MKFSLATLKEFLTTTANTEEITQTLTKIGLEVEDVVDKSQILAQFSVGKILEAKPVENSTKLKICLVEVANYNDKNNSNTTQKLQIICGAPNARANIKVAYAPINSIIPSNLMQIKKAKIAGIESNGMLCSSRELNLGNDDNGIIEIDDKFAIGTKISEVFGINDAIIEVNITPNRGDCLGVVGIASDLSATGIGTFKKPIIPNVKGSFKFDLNIKNLDKNNCPAISFRILKNIKNCQSPEWLVKKLESAGLNSISAVVDITNYVMHILNRPMHAYDLDKIKGAITVDKAKQPQEFISLKNSQHQITDNILTISDDDKILSIAGIMGSLSSSCTSATTNLLLESAYFNKESVAQAGRALNILSESRSRFERGVDYKSCLDGIELATQLILEICGGEASEIYHEDYSIKPQIIDFDFNQFKKITGVDIDKAHAFKILEDLGFKALNDNQIVVPSPRHDIFSSADLVEEILRIYGYDKISNIDLDQTKLDFASHNSHNNHLNYQHKTRLLLASKGLVETISWSFVDKNILQYFCDINDKLILKNPISSEMNHMRMTLAIGLVKSYQKNYLREFRNIAFFEIGNVFDDEKTQKLMISGLRAGKNKEQNHYHEERDFDFYDIKKDFFDVVDLYGIKGESLQISSDNAPKYYHPHRYACAKLGKNIIGYFGEIHPNINKIFDVKTRLYVFEIFAENLPKPSKNIARKTYQTNDLPVVERDFAIIVDKNLMVGNLIKSIAEINKNLIKEVNIFDIYHGTPDSGKIADDKKSVALRVKIQPSDKTLTGEEIEIISTEIINALCTKHNAKLRDN